MWNTQFAIPLLQFKFNFLISQPRKGRIIIERNQQGRIVVSEVPKITNPNQPTFVT